MPELPDVTVYIKALEARILGEPLENARLASPFLLRSVEPPLKDTFGKRVTALRRLGKRIVIGLEDELFLVIHLMIAGRLHWKDRGAKVPGKIARCLRLSQRYPHLHRSKPEETRLALCATRGSGLGCSRSWRHRGA